MNRRKPSTNDDSKHSKQNPTKPALQSTSSGRQDKIESSSDDDPDFHPPQKRPKRALRRPHVIATKPKGRRLYMNIAKKRRERKEQSSIPTETVAASCSSENSSSQPSEGLIETSNPSLERHDSTGAKSDYLAQCLRYLEQSPLEEDFSLFSGFHEHLFSDIEEIVGNDIESSQNNELQSELGSECDPSNDERGLIPQRSGKNMDILNRGRNEIINDNGLHLASPEIETCTDQKYDSERDSSSIVGEYLKAIEADDHGEIFSTPSSPTNAKIESTNQELSNSNMQSSIAQNPELITGIREDLNSLATTSDNPNEMVGGYLKPTEPKNHGEIFSTHGPPTTVKIENQEVTFAGHNFQLSVSNIRNSHPQNQEITSVRGNMNEYNMTAPITAYSGTENQETTDLKAKFSTLENVVHNVWKKLYELEAAIKNNQSLQNGTASSHAGLLGSGGNLQLKNDSAETKTASGTGFREQPIVAATTSLPSIGCGRFGFIEESAIDSGNSPYQDMGDSKFLLDLDSASNAVSNQQFADSLITSRQQPPPKYEEYTSISSAGNMRIKVVKPEQATELEAAVTEHGSIAELKTQFDSALMVLLNLQDRIKLFSNEKDNPEGKSMNVVFSSDLDSPGRLVMDEDYQSPGPSGIDRNRQMPASTRQSMEISTVADLQQPGPSGINQIRKTSGPLVVDDHQRPGPSGINRIRYTSTTIIPHEPRVSNAEEKIWGELTYFEDSKQVGRSFPCRGLHVRVDCFKNRELNKRNNGYHIGPFRNSDRSRETTGIRNMFECGIMLYFIKGALSIVNHSKCTLYVLSNVPFGKNKTKISREKRQTCIPPDHTVQVLRVPFNKQTNSVIDLKENFDESFYRVYISFEKDWTERGPNELPCWLALQLKTSGEE